MATRRAVLKATAWAAAAPLLAACSKKGDTVPEGELLELGAKAAVEHIRKGELKAERYVARLLKQFEAHKDLNAIVAMNEARVLEAASAVDGARARGDALGLAAGLPFAVKDQIAAAGYPATGGNGALKGYIPKENAPVVESVVKAGGIVFAKTNLPDMVAGNSLAMAAASANPTFGTPRNPYDPRRSTGGSSGGNGAAIGARMVPVAIGEDTGGSVRFPAAWCGLAGLRPSTYTIDNMIRGSNRKRYSDAGIVVPPAGPRDTFGPMARTVADVAFLDQIITGEATPTVAIGETRIAIPRPDYWEQDFIDPGVAKVILAAIAKLKGAGAQLVEIDFDAVRGIADDRLTAALATDSSRDLEGWLRTNLPGVTIADVYKDRPIPPVGLSEGMPIDERVAILTGAAARYAEAFVTNGVAAILSPTIPIPAPLLNPTGENPDQTITIKGKSQNQLAIVIRNIFWGPRLGAPGLNIPAGLSDGLPVGLELAGLPGDDAKILGIGIAVENVLGRIAPPPLMNKG